MLPTALQIMNTPNFYFDPASIAIVIGIFIVILVGVLYQTASLATTIQTWRKNREEKKILTGPNGEKYTHVVSGPHQW